MQLVNVVGPPVNFHVRGDWHSTATTRRLPLSLETVNLDGKRATGGVCTLHHRPPTSSPKTTSDISISVCLATLFFQRPVPFLTQAFTSNSSTCYASGNFTGPHKQAIAQVHRYSYSRFINNLGTGEYSKDKYEHVTETDRNALSLTYFIIKVIPKTKPKRPHPAEGRNKKEQMEDTEVEF
ncbi:hypothetical protein CBL_07433 [Carabus blaptoides fortunei]